MAKSSNKNLRNAARNKKDEFYTQFNDIQKEIEAYLDYNIDTFRDKVVYCNCDDPYESNFFRYFVLNFGRLGLKRLITTSYKPSPIANTQLELFGDDKTLTPKKGRPKITANRFMIINEVGDIDDDGEFNLKDVALLLRQNKNNEWKPLEENGDFRSDECIELLKQADIVVTNPPFSLFREFVAHLMEYDKKFLILGNSNAITYKEIFPLIKDNKLWLGYSIHSGDVEFRVPNYYEVRSSSLRIDEKGNKYIRVPSIRWFTNLDHGRRHQPLSLMTARDNKKFNKQLRKKENSYQNYDNYNAIEVPYTNAIPSDYNGVMGVPITFLDKYNPDQFEILGNSNVKGEREHLMNNTKSATDCTYIKGKPQYARILIKHKK